MSNPIVGADAATTSRLAVHQDVRIPLGDGSGSLAADLYRPDRADQVPALIFMLSPYRKDVTGHEFEPMFTWLAERGYASLLVDLRGTGSSDGARRPITHAAEGDDGVAAVEWAAEQDWCSGAVGMWGASYGCVTALRTAARRPPHLRAVIAITGPTDPGNEAFSIDGARTDFMQVGTWATQMLALQLLPPLTASGATADFERWLRRLHHDPPALLELCGVRENPAWQERPIDLESISVPTLCVGGWRDLYRASTVATFERLKVPKKLIMGPWGHLLPQNSPFEPINFMEMSLHWWDKWLRGANNGVMEGPPVVLYTEPGHGEWRGYSCWPPPHEVRVLTAAAGRTLVVKEKGVDREAAFIGDYHPDPTIGALTGLSRLGLGAYDVMLDQHDDDLRGLSLTGEAVPRAFTLVGSAEVRIRLAGASLPKRIVARLSDVDEDGRSICIALGVVCPRAIQDEYLIQLEPTCWHVAAHRRLRLTISDSDFPRLFPVGAPVHLPVQSLSLRIPVLDQDAGSTIDPGKMPSPESNVPTAGVEGAVDWSITRHPTRNIIAVRIETATPSVEVGYGHRLSSNSETEAIVRSDAPAAATVTGHCTKVAELATGEVVKCTVWTRSTGTGLVVRGQVDVDGVEIFSRVWQSEME